MRAFDRVQLLSDLPAMTNVLPSILSARRLFRWAGAFAPDCAEDCGCFAEFVHGGCGLMVAWLFLPITTEHRLCRQFRNIRHNTQLAWTHVGLNNTILVEQVENFTLPWLFCCDDRESELS